MVQQHLKSPLDGATSWRRGSCWRLVVAPLGVDPCTAAPMTRRSGRLRSGRARIPSTFDNPGGAPFAIIGDDRQTIAACFGHVLAFGPSANPEVWFVTLDVGQSVVTTVVLDALTHIPELRLPC